MISSRDLSELPDIRSFRRLTRSLAMLDAILAPDWEYRFYSFNSHWAEGEMMASMRNGSGDYWFALLCSEGVALHGLAHESSMFTPGSPPAGTFDRLPAEFHANFLHEPAFTTEDSTFCIWRSSLDSTWDRGPVELPATGYADGSADLLGILDGNAQRYVEFAAEYYERTVLLDDVAAVYRHAPLTVELVRRLNPEVDRASLADDLKEIGYPETG